MRDAKKILAIILNILIPAIVTLLILTVGIRLIFFFFPFILAYGISLIANPIVNFLEKHINLRRKHSSMAFVLIVLVVIIALIYLMLLGVLYGIERVIRLLPDIMGSIRTELDNVRVRLNELTSLMPGNAGKHLLGIGTAVMSSFEKLAGGLATPSLKLAGNIVMKLPNALFYTVVIIVASYIFIVDRDNIRGFLNRYMPESFHRYAGYVRNDIKRLVGGYFFAQFKIMLYMIIALWIGLTLLGNKYAFAWAVLIGIFDFLPVFGAGAIIIPWAAVKLLNGAYIYGIGLLVMYVITQVLKNIIQPKIVGESMGLSGMATLFAIFIGFKLKGIGGMIIAIPIALMIIKVYQYGIYDNFIKNVVELYEEVERFRRKYE